MREPYITAFTSPEDMAPKNQEGMENALFWLLSEPPGEYTSGMALDLNQVARVSPFRSNGRARGLHLLLKNGHEFRITVEHSRTLERDDAHDADDDAKEA